MYCVEIEAPTTKTIVTAFNGLPPSGALEVMMYAGALSTVTSALSRSCAKKLYKATTRLHGSRLVVRKVPRGKPDLALRAEDLAAPVRKYQRLKPHGAIERETRPSPRLLRALETMCPKYKARVLTSGKKWIIVKTLR